MTPKRHVQHAAVGLGVGIAVALLTPPSLAPMLRGVCGFDAGAAVYLGLVWSHLMRAGEAISAAAAEEDEGHVVITSVVILVAMAGLAAVFALASHNHQPLHLILGVVTIAISWLLLQTVFAAHYASQYRAGRKSNAERAGLVFPGGGPIRFLDFAYVAFTVGLTFQVSDVTTNTPGMRRIIVVQALLAFVFNTAIIAIAVGVSTSWL